jgi:hypothetical protein
LHFELKQRRDISYSGFGVKKRNDDKRTEALRFRSSLEFAPCRAIWRQTATDFNIERTRAIEIIANRLGPYGAYTREVITFALDNWTNFASKAQGNAGLLSYPAEPHVGFLLAHLATAVNMMPIAKALAEDQKKRRFEECKLMGVEPEEINHPANVQRIRRLVE